MLSAFDGFGCLSAGTPVFCTRRSNRRNRIHGMALRIQAIPNRMLVQRAPAVSCVVADKGLFYRMKEPKKLNQNAQLQKCSGIEGSKFQFTSPVSGEMNIFSSSKLR